MNFTPLFDEIFVAFVTQSVNYPNKDWHIVWNAGKASHMQLSRLNGDINWKVGAHENTYIWVKQEVDLGSYHGVFKDHASMVRFVSQLFSEGDRFSWDPPMEEYSAQPVYRYEHSPLDKGHLHKTRATK